MTQIKPRKSNDGLLHDTRENSVTHNAHLQVSGSAPRSASHNSAVFWGMLQWMRGDYRRCSLDNGSLEGGTRTKKILITFIFRQHAMNWSKAFSSPSERVLSLLGSWVGSFTNCRVTFWRLLIQWCMCEWLCVEMRIEYVWIIECCKGLE